MPDFTLSRTVVSERGSSGSLLALEHDVERLEERQAGLQQRRQLLGEDQQHRRRRRASAHAQGVERRGRGAARADRGPAARARRAAPARPAPRTLRSTTSPAGCADPADVLHPYFPATLPAMRAYPSTAEGLKDGTGRDANGGLRAASGGDVPAKGLAAGPTRPQPGVPRRGPDVRGRSGRGALARGRPCLDDRVHADRARRRPAPVSCDTKAPPGPRPADRPASGLVGGLLARARTVPPRSSATDGPCLRSSRPGLVARGRVLEAPARSTSTPNSSCREQPRGHAPPPTAGSRAPASPRASPPGSAARSRP